MAVVFFGLGILLGAVLVARGGRQLRLDDSGLHVSGGLGRGTRVGWDEITGFSVYRINSAAFVSYSLVGGAPVRERRARGFARALGVSDTPDGMLPTLYGRMTAWELATYLDEWRSAVAAPSA